MLPIINKLKFLSYQRRPTPYGIPVWQWAIKKGRYAFKPTKELP